MYSTYTQAARAFRKYQQTQADLAARVVAARLVC